MRCSRCQQENAPGAKFCGECGARLVAPPESRSESPDAYTPGHLASKILSGRDRLTGERKQVTVLFADLKGSLELLADRDPEDARALLDAVLERMMEAVHRFEGTVNQVMGDGIMALFGAPVAHEDHAVRACYAALRMHRAVAEDAEDFRRRLGVDAQMRVGINSGEVVVRSIGNDLQMDYSAVGQTTHLAARMEQLARPGSTLITASTYRLAERFVDATPQGPIPIKGLKDPVEVWELRRATPVTSTLRALASRAHTDLFGRTDELATLKRLLVRARDGLGQLVVLSGEPGVGKSRLVWELTRAPAAADWQMLDAACVSYGTLTPYLPVRNLLMAYFQIEDGDDARRIREKVANRLVTLDTALASAVSPILALGNVPNEDAEWATLEPTVRRQRIFKAVRDLLLTESRRAPLLLVVENLQWVDSETRAFLDDLAQHLADTRMFVLVSSRPERQREWVSAAEITEIRLEPLAAATAEAFADTLLGAGADLTPLKRRLVSHTAGNPFFLEESVQALVETGALEGERGGYRLAKSVASIQIPDRVQAVLAARIDRLPKRGKAFLQAGAAIGPDVPVALLQAVSDAPSDELLRSLAELEAADFLRTSTLFPDLAYSFKHAITQDVAYASLLKEQRRVLHARIVDALETTYPAERRGEHVERLAYHALRAEAWERAVGYLRDAGERAVARSANREAVAFYEDALRHLPDRPETVTLAIDLRLDLRPPLLQLGRLDDIHRLSKEAETMAQRLHDEDRLARVYSYLVNYHYLLGEPVRTLEYGALCLGIAERRGDPALATLARRYLGHSHHAQGQHRLAIQILEDNLSALDAEVSAGATAVASTTAFVASSAWLAWAFADLGEFDRADACLDRARAQADFARHPYSQAIAWTLTAAVWYARGQVDRAIAPLARSLEICEQASLAVWQPIPATLLGLCLVTLERKDDGLSLLRDGVRRAEALGVMAYLARWVLHLGEGLLAVGDLEAARATADRAMALALAHGERAHEAMAWRLLADIAAHDGDFDAARQAYEQALALADELALRPLIARVHFDLGRLQRRLGHLTDAEDHLACAVVLFADMGMRSWLEQSQPELKALGHLVIVARSNVDLFDYLTEKFADDPDVRIILDRRQGEPHRIGPTGAAERRRHAVDQALRTRGLAIVIAR
ncbi:MAG TPA: adenylate/guanylate cyclase domain-containing protein [Methylomirabilota bacterium]|nr:adenylate/guanylate cyclase domain-containing protein [Methylomirabilota bacterium]